MMGRNQISRTPGRSDLIFKYKVKAREKHLKINTFRLINVKNNTLSITIGENNKLRYTI